MNLEMKILLVILGIVILWFVLGFITFLIAAKMNKVTEFNENTEEMFIILVGFGLFSFIILIIVSAKRLFIKTMNKLLSKMNE